MQVRQLIFIYEKNVYNFFLGYNQMATFYQSQRGRAVLVDSSLQHKYKRDKINSNTTNWRCYTKNCTGRATTKLINGREFMKITRLHSH